jgi:hypothetical protein
MAGSNTSSVGTHRKYNAPFRKYLGASWPTAIKERRCGVGGGEGVTVVVYVCVCVCVCGGGGGGGGGSGGSSSGGGSCGEDPHWRFEEQAK